MKVDCRKRGLHPTYIEDIKVYCDGQLIMVTGGTQKELTVDTWSGNHAFYLGQNMSGDDEDFFGNDEWSKYFTSAFVFDEMLYVYWQQVV